jgi:ABC-type glycerol-3-phosphate transport system permease component
VVIFLAPVLFLLSTSIQSEDDIYKLPPKWIPRNPTLTPYAYLFATFPILKWIFNTFFYTLFTVILQLALCSAAAYAFSRLRFWGKNFLFLLILSTFMIPFEVRMIPLYLVNYKLGLADQRWGLILPNVASPFSLFLFVQFFRQIPKDLEDSAMIDGCSRFRIFTDIIVPLSKNAFLVLAILITIYCWNDFFWPLININDIAKQVLSIGIFNLLSSNLMARIGYPLATAGCVVMAFPLIVVYILFQKNIINAYLFSGIKG